MTQNLEEFEKILISGLKIEAFKRENWFL